MKTLVKKTLILLLVSASVVMFGACEKVIELDLNNSQPVLVIEGGVSNQLGYHQVKISKTISFDKKNDFNPHRGASVSLTSDGKTMRYIEISPGIYRSPAFRGIPGVEYTLNVMPGPVALDSIDLKRFSFLGDTNTYVASVMTIRRVFKINTGILSGSKVRWSMRLLLKIALIAGIPYQTSFFMNWMI